MKVNNVSTIISNTSFGYKSILKTYYKQGLLPSVKYGFYGGYLTKASVSLEHIIPHSKGGISSLENYALATISNNSHRGCQPLIKHFKRFNALRYLKQFIGIKLPKFNGDKYVEDILFTLKSQDIEIEMEEVLKHKVKF